MDIRDMVCTLSSSDQYKILCNKKDKKYVVTISRLSPEWFYDLCDLIDFYENSAINVTLDIWEKELHKARELYGTHRFDEKTLRSYESKVLVHSTLPENVESVFSDGELKSWNILKKENEGWEEHPIGILLGDIEDFSNYIMLSDIRDNNEVVVASKQKHVIDINIEQRYKPGVRIYLDAAKLAKDGLLLRDGEHIKVKDRISLEKYMIWYATTERIGIAAETTPKEFFEESNKMFEQLFPQYL